VARRLIFDTGVFVDAERGKLDPADLHNDEDDVTITAVTVAELVAGVYMADERNRARRQRFVEDVRRTFGVMEFDERVAEVHGELLAFARRSGRPRGTLDLIVAATAVANRRVLVTTDARARFDGLPGLDVEVVGRRSG